MTFNHDSAMRYRSSSDLHMFILARSSSLSLHAMDRRLVTRLVTQVPGPTTPPKHVQRDRRQPPSIDADYATNVDS